MSDRKVRVAGDPAPSGPPRLSVGDERHFTVTSLDRGYGVGDVNHEGRTTYRCVVGKSGLDAQVLGSGHRGKSGGENAVHVILGESGVRQGIVGRFRMVLQR